MDVIQLHNVSKTYTHYAHGVDRLLEILTHRTRHQAFVALQALNLSISQGQVVGIIGNNGAGKSTLLKLIANTLQPDTGTCQVHGRVAALLELGGGFHPEMTGRENVYLNGTMMGLSPSQIDVLYNDIVAFAGIADFMGQQVKTYSSGMFVRLAFAVATCMEPDVLIVDEALSVGDGAFARKSFNRIMDFKYNNKTILFCSHALYQVEAICDRVLWLEHGQLKQDGRPSEVIAAYSKTIAEQPVNSESIAQATAKTAMRDDTNFNSGVAKIIDVTVSVDGLTGRTLDMLSCHSELCVTFRFSSDINLPPPTLGLIVVDSNNNPVTSAGTHHDQLMIERNAQGEASVRVVFPKFALLKGTYTVDAYLLCENAVHVYDTAVQVATLNVTQHGLEQGVVSLPRLWTQI